MSGAALSLGALAVTATLALGCAAVGSAAIRTVRLSGVADAAALAAADAATGAVPGTPCERAADLADLGGARLISCELDGLLATVHLEAPFGLFPASARARAGPAP